VTRLLEVPVASGGSVLFEIDALEDRRAMRGGMPVDGLIERGQQTLEEGLGTIAPALGRMLDELRGVSHDLSEIEVELGLKLAGEAGMVIARVGSEANFRVLVRWKRATESE
jgi:Trypsin-co-occurring domain 1